jgi:hypothetical protein
MNFFTLMKEWHALWTASALDMRQAALGKPDGGCVMAQASIAGLMRSCDERSAIASAIDTAGEKKPTKKASSAALAGVSPADIVLEGTAYNHRLPNHRLSAGLERYGHIQEIPVETQKSSVISSRRRTRFSPGPQTICRSVRGQVPLNRSRM